MYTGELFFEPREDIEHLAMMEKQCGPISQWMVSNARQKCIRNIFLRNGETKNVDNYNMRVNWP